MAVTYTTSAKVAALLGITTLTVDAIIERMEDFIDAKTGHAWRTKAIPQYEYYPISPEKQKTSSGEIAINLQHRSITTLASATDTLEMWNGSSWTNCLTGMTESRGSDYWVNYADGIIYFRTFYGSGPDRIRIKYRYGESSVPLDIEDACTKLAAMDVINSQDSRSVVFPEGGNFAPGSNSMIEKWRRDVDEVLAARAEFGTAR